MTYVDRAEASTVPSSHVLVHALDSVSTAEVAVLLVHVVGTRARIVSEPDAEVLDLQRLLFVDLRKKTRPQRTISNPVPPAS